MSLPLDVNSGATWVFWIGIVVGFLGFGLAYAGYVADRQTNERIGLVEATAQQRISDAQLEAQRRISEVEAKTAARRLNPAQRVAFESFFRSPNHDLTVAYLTGMGTGEVGGLITDILDAARTAGVKTNGAGTSFGVLPPGISLEIPANDSEMLRRADSLGRALGVLLPVNANQPPGHIIVFLGARAPGFP